MFKRVSTMMVAAGLAVSSILTPVAASPAEAAGLPDLQVIRKGDSSQVQGKPSHNSGYMYLHHRWHGDLWRHYFTPVEVA